MKDNELIYLYRTEQNITARDILYQKYKSMLDSLTYTLFKKNPNWLTMEYGDYVSNSYLAFMECLKTYDIKQCKYVFAQALAILNRNKILNNSTRLMMLNQRALTIGSFNASSYDHAIRREQNRKVYSMEDKINDDLTAENLNNFVKRFNKKTQEIVKLKLDGYMPKEITKKLGISRRVYINLCNNLRHNYVSRYA